MKKFTWLILIMTLALVLVACDITTSGSNTPAQGEQQSSETGSATNGTGGSQPDGTQAPDDTSVPGNNAGSTENEDGPTITVDVEDDPTEPAGTTPTTNEDEPKDPTVGVDTGTEPTESSKPDNVIDFDDLLDAANKNKGQ